MVNIQVRRVVREESGSRRRTSGKVSDQNIVTSTASVWSVATRSSVGIMAVLPQLRCRVDPGDESPISGKELARQSSQKAILAHILVVCSSVIHALDRNIHQLHKAVFFEEDIVILPVSRRSLARTICSMGAEVVM